MKYDLPDLLEIFGINLPDFKTKFDRIVNTICDDNCAAAEDQFLWAPSKYEACRERCQSEADALPAWIITESAVKAAKKIGLILEYTDDFDPTRGLEIDTFESDWKHICHAAYDYEQCIGHKQTYATWLQDFDGDEKTCALNNVDVFAHLRKECHPIDRNALVDSVLHMHLTEFQDMLRDDLDLF